MKTSNLIQLPVLLPLLVELAACCGVTTHMVIGHRAASNYDSQLDELTNTAQVISSCRKLHSFRIFVPFTLKNERF